MPAKKRASSSSQRQRVTFAVQCAPGSVVFLTGTFNQWAPAGKAMKDAAGDGHFTATCMLAPGTYEYKFVINGEWFADASNPRFVGNQFGTLNSVIQVP